MKTSGFGIRMLLLVTLFTLSFLLVNFACGDDDDDDDDDDSSADDDDNDDSADDDDSAVDDDDDDDDDDSTTYCGEFSFNLHSATAGWVYLKLSDMTANLTEVDQYDFKIGHLAKAEDIDYILLGQGVQAQNLGNETAFSDVVEAPEGGYASDDGEDYVIGTDWQIGGSCPTGWTMSENVYALVLQDGTYAKISVTYAMQGDFLIAGFRQADESRDLTCVVDE